MFFQSQLFAKTRFSSCPSRSFSFDQDRGSFAAADSWEVQLDQGAGIPTDLRSGGWEKPWKSGGLEHGWIMTFPSSWEIFIIPLT